MDIFKPVLDLKAFNSGELTNVISDQDEIQRYRLGGDEEIVRPDGRPSTFDLRPDARVDRFRRLLQVEYLERFENPSRASIKPLRTLLPYPEPDLGGHNDACT